MGAYLGAASRPTIPTHHGDSRLGAVARRWVGTIVLPIDVFRFTPVRTPLVESGQCVSDEEVQRRSRIRRDESLGTDAKLLFARMKEAEVLGNVHRGSKLLGP